MDITEFIRGALERGDLIGLGAVVLVLSIGAYLKSVAGQTSRDVEKDAPDTSDDQVKSVVTRLDSVDQRLSKVENDLAHMPTQKDFHDLEVRVATMGQHIIGIERTTESTGRAVGRIEDFLLSIKRGK